MSTPRDWMTLEITSATKSVQPVIPASPGLRPFTTADADPLAHLMLDSYRGSVDDNGETLEDAKRDVAKLLAGDFGATDYGASVVVEHAGDLASATIITRDRVAPPPLAPGEAFLAFSMTAPTWKRQGLARSGLTHAIAILRSRGEPRLHLVVTRTNTPAVALYRALGFSEGPLSG